jgi:hypothetical protein
MDVVVATLEFSGEPVISAAKKIPNVLGLLSASIPITDGALGTTQRIGLGVVYSAEATKAVVNSF